jgi:hypothetical protein
MEVVVDIMVLSVGDYLGFPCQFSIHGLAKIDHSSYHPTLYNLDTDKYVMIANETDDTKQS